jgi:2'-5' RNA ligase
VVRSWRPGLPHSAVFLPVPEAETAVGRWRELFDPMAGAGVPAHITLVVPWLAPEAITDTDLHRLGEVLGKTLPFDYELAEEGWFGPGVLWLGPRPVEPFLEVIEAVAEEFATPPWGGEYRHVVPHLTVAHTIEGHQLERVAERVARDLPIRCRAREATIMVGHGSQWWQQAQLRFD